MNKKTGRIATMLFVVISIICVSLSTYAHSGRTDSSGGHRDNQNKSGLGSYHYHCGGHPPHLHNNGVCPYSTASKKTTTTNKKTTSSSKTSTTPKSTTVKATKIKINEKIDSIYVGKSENVTATISTNNVTDKKVTWKSSDENIAIVSSTGKITAKEEGKVTITASTSNGKTSSIEIDVIRKREEVNNINPIKNNVTKNDTIETSTSVNINKNDNTYNATNNVNESEEDGTVGGIVTMGALGGGYLLYRKNKKNKKISQNEKE